MTRLSCSLILALALSALAAADGFQNVAAHGVGSYTVATQTTRYTAGSSNTINLSGDASFYAGSGDYSSLYDVWTYSYDVYIGDDPDTGQPLYESFNEDQYESATAEANAYARFDRGLNSIDAEVYAYSAINSWASGSQATASAFAAASASMDLTFTLSANTMATLSVSTLYGDGNLSLYHNGDWVIDTNTLGTRSTPFFLAAGDYQIAGATNSGGANLSILLAPVPEPASLAALGLGGALVLRRRRTRAVL